MSNGKQFTLSDVEFLTSGSGIELLANLQDEDLSDSQLLQLIPKLRSTYSQQETSAAIETAKLRQRAVSKFGDAALKMLFTQDAIEQASHPLIRQYRADCSENPTMVDVCCSIGSDSFAYAASGVQVVGVDFDPVRIAMAQHNADVLGLAIQFQVMDVEDQDLPLAEAIFFDPARRDENGKRIYNVNRYRPPLSLIERWRSRYGQISVKLSPGIDLEQIETYTGSVSFISVDGELKEAVLDTSQASGLFAVRLSAKNMPLVFAQSDHPVDNIPIIDPVGWLHEPDPAILRAQHVKPLASQLNAGMLDETIGYLISEHKPDDADRWGWVRSWQIIDWMPFNLKKLKAYLKARHVGHVTIKKRGSPILPEVLQKKLKLRGTTSLTIVLTRLRGEPIVIICADVKT